MLLGPGVLGNRVHWLVSFCRAARCPGTAYHVSELQFPFRKKGLWEKPGRALLRSQLEKAGVDRGTWWAPE